MQLLDDVPSNLFGRGGRERMDCGVWKMRSERSQLAILGPKIMSPLGHAVGFIDGDRVEIGSFQKFQELR